MTTTTLMMMMMMMMLMLMMMMMMMMVMVMMILMMMMMLMLMLMLMMMMMMIMILILIMVMVMFLFFFRRPFSIAEGTGSRTVLLDSPQACGRTRVAISIPVAPAVGGRWPSPSQSCFTSGWEAAGCRETWPSSG